MRLFDFISASKQQKLCLYVKDWHADAAVKAAAKMLSREKRANAVEASAAAFTNQVHTIHIHISLSLYIYIYIYQTTPPQSHTYHAYLGVMF